MIKFPPANKENKILRQLNRTKILGELWSSFNLDLQSSLGIIRVSPRLQVNTASVSNQGTSVAFRQLDNRIWTVADTRIFKNSALNLVSTFSEDASTGAITTYSADYSDMENFNNVLVASATDKLMSKATGSGTGAWTSRYSLVNSDSLHKLLYFKKYDMLYFIDEYTKIKSVDTSWTVNTSGSNTIDLGKVNNAGNPYTMIDDSDSIWIGMIKTTPNISSNLLQGGSIYKWDGISSTVSTEYKIKAQGVLAFAKDDKGVIHALDSNGALLAFNSNGFEEIGRLPLNRSLLTNATTNGLKYNTFVHPNGMCFTRNGTFQVLVNNKVGDSSGSIKENLPSGIWEFSKDTGFVHKQALTYNPITTSTITDYGQNRISRAGALYEANIYSESANGKPMLICGADYFTDETTVTSGIFVDDPNDSVQKYGYFVTTWILSQNVRDTWNKMWAKFRKFLDSGDKIVIKYRVNESDSTPISITWTSTTTFTTLTNVTGMEGYEVEVTQGTGSGKCSHIRSIVNNAGTYTVTVDETYTGVTSGTAKARIQNWTKSGSYSIQQDEYAPFSFLGNVNTPRIQIKVCLQFKGDDEFYELAVINSVFQALA